jgi:hypothetical protein
MPRSDLYNRRVAAKICVCCKTSLGDQPTHRKCQQCLTTDNNYRKKNRTQKVVDSEREYRQKVWFKRCVWKSTRKDRLKNRTSGDPMVKPIRLQTLRVLQLNKCFYCLTDMQVLNRKKPNGLTIERLDNTEPHTTKNCILCCNRCNCKRLSDKHNLDIADAFDLIFERFENSNLFPKFLQLLACDLFPNVTTLAPPNTPTNTPTTTPTTTPNPESLVDECDANETFCTETSRA